MEKFETAILANGCFWCTEAIFQKMNGVIEVTPGYIGGYKKDPTYEEVCTGLTKHAEAVKLVFDNTKVSFQELLEVFFSTHDPTTLNRQGNDVGTQYRSEIFYTNEAQKDIAQQFLDVFNNENIFGKKVVTAISKASEFYPAENYHINYYNTHKDQMYCSNVIKPKLDNFTKIFKELL